MADADASPELGASAPKADAAAPGAAAASSSPRPFFRVRLMNIDHVLVQPGPHDRAQSAFNPPGVPLRRVPVVRIFGATPQGQRVCLHVHGVFPYCYVQYHGSLHPDEVLAHIARLGRSLNASLAASLRRDLSNPLTATSYIAAIHLVQGVPFYGYHVGARYFLKISFVDPSHNFRLATILQSGRVLGTVFQPFECHIRYQLQFMLDHNVYGCDYVDLERAFFRPPFPDTPEKPALGDGIWHAGSIPPQFVQRPSPARASFCTLEVDAPAAAILNRRLLRPRNIHYSIPEPAPSTSENAQRLVPSLTELWEEERQRRARAGLPPSIPVPDTAGEARRYGPGGAPAWMAEERLRAALRERCDEDERYRLEHKYDARSYEGGNANDRFIVSAFESVELFHDAPAPQGASDPQTQAQTQHLSTSQHAAASIYDLEHALTQHRVRTHSGDTSQSAVSGSPASSRPPGSAPASQTLPSASPLSDAEERAVAADADFFASQAFQDAMREFELEGQRADEADEGSDAGDDPALDNALDAAAPETPRASRTVDAFKQSTPRQASRFSAPGTPQHTPTSAQSTPRRRPLDAQSTPKGRMPLERTALSTPRKRHISDIMAASREELQRTPRRQHHDGDETTPRSAARSIAREASHTNAESPGSGAEKLREMLDGAGADWRVLPDSQAAKGASQSQRATRADVENAAAAGTTAADLADPTARATVTGATQRVRFGAATAEATTALPSESGDSGASRSDHSRATVPTASRSDASVRQWQYAQPAPSTAEVLNSFGFFGLPNVEHQDPFYSDPADVPKGAREYAGRSFRFVSKTLRFLPAFRPGNADVEGGKKAQQSPAGVNAWTASLPPPTRKSVQKWAHKQRDTSGEKRVQAKVPSTRPMPTAAKATQAADAAFKLSQRQPTVLVEKEKQHITVFAVELLVCTRGDLMPDPAKDAISAIAFSFQNEDDELEDTGSRAGLRTGLLLLDKQGTLPDPARLGIAGLDVEVLSTELELFNALVDLVRTLDPEILVGWEIHNSSWGYVVDRAMKELNFDIILELGRVNTGSTGGKGDKWGYTQTSGIKVTGRHMLNIWRLMRGELTLNQYSFDNVVFHLLRRRTPRFTHAVVTQWYSSGVPALMKRALAYWIERTEIDLEVIETSEVVFRTAEFARIYGVDFFSVISRGSQFKVESVMFRIAKPESFILPSPNQQQVGEQNAAEALPLVMEPQSAFYKGPLLVLDFTSLYPSLMIAYNLCYSTCLGRVSKFRDSWKLGFTEYVPPRGLLSLLEKDCFVSPNGMLFAKPHIRRSLLAKMLGEILETRVMVKGSVKGMKGEKAFKRLQNARQLSLKLLANVTYGYTSATFSGRMPCVEVADAIVQYGRETLERAISLIHATTEWGATVVYGDTDSLFIYLPGRTKEDAFRIGHAMADAVTADNPAPVKLKFEKVYLPSLLMAKKRYVGFMYETEDQAEPAFNAKGIETVRRDGFPAQQRMVEACIRILFRTQDLSLVKSYCQRQWRKIFEGRVPFSDFIIAKEVRLGSYSENGVPPPGAAIATRRLLLDRRNEPQHAERVPYIISQGMPRAKLNDQAVTPEQMLESAALRINARYYIERGLIPPLSRIFNLMGTDVSDWYRDMPRAVTSAWGGRFAADDGAEARPAAATRLTLADHYRSEHCLVCGRRTELDICPDCRQDLPTTTGVMASRLHGLEQRSEAMARVCASCAGFESVEDAPCVSTDCAVLYEKTRVAREAATARKILHHVVVAIEPDEAPPSDGSVWGASAAPEHA